MQEEHCGWAGFPHAQTYVPDGDRYLCRGIDAYRTHIRDWSPPWEWETRGNYRGHLGGAANERPPSVPPALVTGMSEGDVVAGMRVIATPGHGKNALSVVGNVDGRRVAFCGDAAHAGGRMWCWYDCDWDYGLGSGHRAAMASAARLASLELDLLCPAHGPVVQAPSLQLAELADRIGRALAPVPASPNVPHCTPVRSGTGQRAYRCARLPPAIAAPLPGHRGRRQLRGPDV